MTDVEWGPWIDHDGNGCPCKGLYMQAELNRPPATCPSYLKMVSPKIVEGIVPLGLHLGHVWMGIGQTLVIRYRTRKSHGIAILKAAHTQETVT